MYSEIWAIEMYRKFFLIRGRAPGLSVELINTYASSFLNSLRSGDNKLLAETKTLIKRALLEKHDAGIRERDANPEKFELLYACIANKNDFYACLTGLRGKWSLTAKQQLLQF
jgi:hypothetical protein